MVCSTIYSLSTPPHRHVREHGDVSHLEGMPQYGGVILRHVLRLACVSRRGKFSSFHPYGTISSFLIRLFSWIPGSLSFFHSWSCSKCWRPILPEITFSRSVRSLLDNVALVLLSRPYRFSGSKDPPLLEVVFLLPKVKSPFFAEFALFVFLFVFSS
jgi:hypothetical protein